MKAVEMQRKESGESHSSEELQTKLTEILIETLYRFEGSEEMKNLQARSKKRTGGGDGYLPRESREARLAARTPPYRSRVAATARRAGAAEHAP